MAWSQAQLEAITIYNKNLLVAAAAGSGKTSVLVERIIRRLLDETQEFDIDEVLVVTFTNAAAAEMRERISAAIGRALKERPQSHRLERQLVLLNASSISTLHAFCQTIIRQNFHLLDLDPTFRLANAQETELLKRDVLEDLFEARYAADDAEFLRFVDHYGDARGDESLCDIILNLYAFSRSQPNPEEWLRRLPEPFDLAGDASIDETVWAKLLTRQCALVFHECLALTETLIQAAEQIGFEFYVPAFQNDQSLLQSLTPLLDRDWDTLRHGLNAVKFAALPRAPKDTDEVQKEYFSKQRQRIKDKIKALNENYFAASGASLMADLRAAAPMMRSVCTLTIMFAAAFWQAKRAKSIVDFNDLEHLCLEILRDPVSGAAHPLPSSVALALQKKYKEVMVDEYQDINGVQEAILSLVRSAARPNLFLVGDVKQSVYRFRLAEPDLFLEKYHTYPQRGEAFRRIDLAQNFRSHSNVLAAINFLFAQVMSPTAAELSYGASERLNPGSNDPPAPGPTVAGAVELQLIDRDSAAVAEEDAREELKGFALESQYIAARIQALIASSNAVFDKEKQAYRPLEWRDIVILLRSVKNKASILLETLHNNDIPAYAGADTGYFQEIEIQVMLSLLQVIDNPEQDIPLASVLHSPIGGFTAEALSRIRLLAPGDSLFTALLNAASPAADLPETIKARVLRTLQQLRGWRTLSRGRSVPELIWQLFRDTGYYEYVGGMPGGLLRQANLRMLYDRARQYETTNFRGLFRFLRFIGKMRDTGTDLAVARTLGESENVVRIMSIHKSKGLEFPIVIVADLGKKFNLQDSAAALLIHKKLGLGPYVTSIEPNLRYPTIARLAIAAQMNRESKAEELRVLYVALTRAREKLILIGSAGNLIAKAAEWRRYAQGTQTLLPDYAITGAGSYLDWLCPAVARHEDGAPLRDYSDTVQPWIRAADPDHSHWQITITPAGEIAAKKARPPEEDDLLEQIRAQRPLPETAEREWVYQTLDWQYPDEGASDVPAKLSVTEMKRQFDPRDEISTPLFQPPLIVRRPRFLQEKTAPTGAEYGTILHSIMQHLDFHGDITAAGIGAQLDRLIERELLLPAHRSLIDPQKICAYCESTLGRRMRSAVQLRRELPFSVMIAAQRFYPAVQNAAERIFVQGIVDVLFDEPDGGMVLIDYKTDRGSGSEIAAKYQLQLSLYAEAIEKILGRPVKESYLYLFATGEIVQVAKK